MTVANLETIVDMQSWFKIWHCSGYNPTHVVLKLPRIPEEPNEVPGAIYTDNSSKFGKSCKELSWNHCTSRPHRSETNGIAERAVRRVKEGTSAVLLQADLNESSWADSMECYCYLRNIQDILSDGTKGGSECPSTDQ